MSRATTYIAFLRGVNVGGRKPVKMDALRQAFVSLGFERVRTVLNSGNVIFDASPADPTSLASKVERGLKKSLSLDSSVIVRTGRKIEELVGSEPFSTVEEGPQTRLLVSFLPGPPPDGFKTPLESSDGDYVVLKSTPGEVFSVLELSSRFGTPDLMKILERELGPGITTRTWNTVLKIREKL